MAREDQSYMRSDVFQRLWSAFNEDKLDEQTKKAVAEASVLGPRPNNFPNFTLETTTAKARTTPQAVTVSRPITESAVNISEASSAGACSQTVSGAVSVNGTAQERLNATIFLPRVRPNQQHLKANTAEVKTRVNFVALKANQRQLQPQPYASGLL